MRRALVLAVYLAAPPLAAQKTEGPAEFVRDTLLYIDGQPVMVDGLTKFKGIKGVSEIKSGYWLKSEGRERLPDGRIVAKKLEGRPPAMEKGEAEIIKMSDEVEKAWVQQKMVYEPIDSTRVQKIGDILETGPEVDRARAIMARLRPDYIPAEALRVRVVKTKDWNASCMANGAVWVYSGLMEALNDDELALVLGHELAHFTYEHMRRKMFGSKSTIGQLLATGGQVAGAMVGGTAGQLAAMGSQLGASALVTGFSREFEDQADRAGLRYAWEGGYDPKVGPGLWEKFRTKYGENDKITNFFTGDHSRPTERIKNIEKQVAMHYQGTPPAKK